MVRGTSEKPASTEEVCVVPASGETWPFYLRHDVFVTAANKTFRSVPRFAFYTSRLVRPLAPAVLQVLDEVPLQDSVIARLSLSIDPTRRRVGESLAAVAGASTSDAPVKLVVLTTADDPRTINIGEIEHHGRGPWVRTRRYVSLAQLAAAGTTSDVRGAVGQRHIVDRDRTGLGRRGGRGLGGVWGCGGGEVSVSSSSFGTRPAGGCRTSRSDTYCASCGGREPPTSHRVSWLVAGARRASTSNGAQTPTKEYDTPSRS